MKLPIFSKALGFSLLSLYVNPALCLQFILACPHVTCPIDVGFRPTVLASSFCSLHPTNKILKETSLDLRSFLRSFLGFSLDGRPIKFQIHSCRGNIVGIIRAFRKLGPPPWPPLKKKWEGQAPRSPPGSAICGLYRPISTLLLFQTQRKFPIRRY